MNTDLSNHLRYIGSIEFQAAHTIWEKYKRSLELSHKELRRLEFVSHFLSEERKVKGKVPNVDFLTQEVGKFLKGEHSNQKDLDIKVFNLLEFEKNDKIV